MLGADPVAQDLRARLEPPLVFPGGTPDHLLGTDQLGRDILSRTLFAARISLGVGAGGLLVAGLVGILIGTVAGYFGGIIDALLMRLVDAQLSIPFILLSIAVAGAIGPSVTNLIAVLALTEWPVFARVSRASVLRIRTLEYVEAAVLAGASDSRIMFRHVLPNATSALTVIASFSLATMILNEAALSFLGLGIQPPTPSWGNMLGDGRDYLLVAWWLTVIPGLTLVITILCVNVIGEALRTRLDVRSERSR